MSAQNDTAFLRVFIIILSALFAFTLTIVFVAHSVSAELNDANADQDRVAAQVAERIAPIGQVKVTEAAAPVVAKSGDDVAAAACNACHISGVMGAPKVGDQAAWETRLAQGGIDSLYLNAINGKGGMPPRGGAADLSDDDVRAAVNALLNKSGLPQ